jgi:hypothetical protein
MAYYRPNFTDSIPASTCDFESVGHMVAKHSSKNGVFTTHSYKEIDSKFMIPFVACA